MSGMVDSPEGLRISSDVMYEDWFPLVEVHKNEFAYKLLGEPVPITLRRASRSGRKSPITGKRVKLEVAIGSSGQLCTSDQACRRFIERLNGVLD